MKIGVNLINFGPSANPHNLRRSVQLVETLGYHLLMTSDHIAITPDVQARYPAPFYEPFSTLGWLAGITSRLEIGTTVLILPYRNVLETAKVGANVDQLSGGRFILGIGVGWAQGEFDVLGVPYHQRGAMTDDYLRALQQLWTHDRASYTGKYITFQDVQAEPRPVQTPHPPIWVGGGSDAAMRRTIRYGNAWHPIRIRLETFQHTQIPRLRELADREQRPVPALCPRIRLRLTASPMPEDQRLAGEGSLDQVRQDLATLEALGCTYVLLDTFYDDVEATRQVETAWQMLSTMAEQVFDLAQESLK